MRVSYLEIYNEQCYDLLDISTQPSDIAIVEDSKDRVVVKGLAAPIVATEAEALQYLFEVCPVLQKEKDNRPKQMGDNEPLIPAGWHIH